MSIFDRFKKHKKEVDPKSIKALKHKSKDGTTIQKKDKVDELSRVAKSKKPEKTELRKFDDVHNILIRPLVTEKISNLGMHNQYAFEVSADVNKVQIKKAIETYYQVRPVKVRLMNIQGKNVRWGRRQGRTKSRKKAMVTLRQGDKIELYEGV